MWVDVVAMYRDQFSRVVLVPTGIISGVSTVIEKGVPGVVEAPSADQGGSSSSVAVPAPASQVSPSSFQTAVLLEGCR